jgi:tetratricopeptide (TPR) repeat protein
MNRGLRKFVLIVAFLVAFEGFVFLRWTFFNGPKPSLHDWQTGLGILIALWAASKIAGWFEQREARDKEIAARIRDIDVRVEALYKWGGLCSSEHDGEENDDWEWELDDETKAEITEYRKGIREGDRTSRHNLGVTFWNRAMPYYNAHTDDGYREAIRWLRKAASLDYSCENTLGDAYIKLQDYDEAMYWYRRSFKRGGSLVWIAESDIADMYAEGQGASQNHAEAARWWDRAAKHGSDWAHYKLGKLYAEGADGVEKDRRKAYFHLYIASSAIGQHGQQASCIELREKVEKELGEYFVLQEKKRAEEWLAAKKEVAPRKVQPLPLPE